MITRSQGRSSRPSDFNTGRLSRDAFRSQTTSAFRTSKLTIDMSAASNFQAEVALSAIRIFREVVSQFWSSRYQPSLTPAGGTIRTFLKSSAPTLMTPIDVALLPTRMASPIRHPGIASPFRDGSPSRRTLFRSDLLEKLGSNVDDSDRCGALAHTHGIADKTPWYRIAVQGRVAKPKNSLPI